MKNGASPAKESIWQYFVTKCSVNLHVVLCMSPTGDTLRTRCRNFPGLINNAIIDWFLPWPEQALYAVSTSLLSEDVRSCFSLTRNHQEYSPTVRLLSLCTSSTRLRL